MKLSTEKETMKQWFTEHKMNKTIVFFPKLAFETSGKKGAKISNRKDS